jgi:glycosyltransferase involved in cell wall biosynthesis
MKFTEFLEEQTIFDNGYQALTPSASIVMPTYSRNKEGLLAGCIESVLAQTFQDFEFIIIDDGSSDGTQDVIIDYARRDPRLVYVRHEINSGLPAVRTDEGILMARAPYIGFIFDDNTWFPDTLEQLMNAIHSPSVDAVYGCVEMDRGGESFDFGMVPLSLETLNATNLIPNGTVLCSREFFKRVGLYDPHLLVRRICDWDLWLRAAHAGIHFKQINARLGIERGLRSPVSLGNTVHLDTKIAFSYIFDTDRRGERTAALVPERILEYDVFDPEQVITCVRDLAEWEQVNSTVYQPYFEKHPNYKFTGLLRNNRRYDPALFGFRINAQSPVFRHRKRLLILTNRLTRGVSDFIEGLKSNPDWMVIQTTEWTFSLFAPEEIDALILIDCSGPVLIKFINACQERQMPVIFLVSHGLDQPSKSDCSAFNYLDLTQDPLVRRQFNTPIYYGLAGFPWPKEHRENARLLIEACEMVITLGESNDALLAEFPVQSFPFIPNSFPSPDPLPQPDKILYYLANPSAFEPAVLDRTARNLQQICQETNYPVQVIVSSLVELPAQLKEVSSEILFWETNETLPNLVNRFNDAAWIVPSALLAVFPEYHLKLMKEDLSRGGGTLIEVPDRDTAGLYSAEAIDRSAESLLTSTMKENAGYRSDARWLQFRNLVQGILLRRKIANFRGLSLSREVRSMVLINSQAMAGSETYGLLVAKALRDIGFDVQIATHASYDHYPPGIRTINSWLAERNLPSLITAEYGKVVRSIGLPEVPEEKLQEYSNQLDKWLEGRGIGLVFSSGFISEPMIGWNERRLFFMSLFAPWDYSLGRMTFMRNRVNGVIFDTEWARRLWSRWLPPPTTCVPSLVEHDYFTIRNLNLPSNPVRIAIAGTIQPRKRQIEAAAACLNLIREGYDIELHFYGYELISFKNYISELRSIINQPVFENRAFFHGFVEDAMEIPRNNHIIFSPSTDESLPQSLIFCQASGLLAVASPAGGVEEFILDGKTGFLAKGFSVEDCTDALRRALDQQSNWPAIIQRARQHVADYCSDQIFTSRLLEVMSQGIEIHLSEGRRLFDTHPNPYAQKTRRTVRRSVNASQGAIDISNLVIGPEIGRAPLTYSLHCSYKNLAGLRFRLGTFFTNPQGKILFTLFPQKGGRPLRQVSLDLDKIKDNDWVTIKFQPVANSQDQIYHILVEGKVSGGRVSIYESLLPRMKSAQRMLLLSWRAVRRLAPLPVKRPLAAFHPYYEE